MKKLEREHLVRATEIMVWKKLGKEKRAEQKLKDEYEKEGMLYIAAFVHSLEKYESKRQQYPTLESYFTVLIRDLTALMNN